MNKVPPMPKIANLPRPQLPPQSSNDQIFADEALRAAQRHFDQIAEITRLTDETEEWRRRALTAQAEIKRLEMVEAGLRKQIEKQAVDLTAQRDDYRDRLVRFEERLTMQGKILLDQCGTVSEFIRQQLNEIRVERGGPDAGKLGLSAIADAIESDPLPRVVAAGPAEPEQQP